MWTTPSTTTLFLFSTNLPHPVPEQNYPSPPCSHSAYWCYTPPVAYLERVTAWMYRRVYPSCTWTPTWRTQGTNGHKQLCETHLGHPYAARARWNRISWEWVHVFSKKERKRFRLYKTIMYFKISKPIQILFIEVYMTKWSCSYDWWTNAYVRCSIFSK